MGCEWRYQVITTVERPRHLPARVARLGSLKSKGALNMSEIHVPRRLGQDEDGIAAQAALTQYPQDCRPPGGIALMVVSGDVADNGASQGHDAVQAPVRAQPADAERLLALREAAASWLVGRGVRQWEPGEVTLQQVRDQVAAGEWFVARCGESVVGALRLLWQDEQIWGPQPPDAAYVHGLVVDRAHAGLGLGRALLDWAWQQAQRAGRRQLRLDCSEDNAALTAYYHRQGFETVGRRDFAGRWYSVVLLNKPLEQRS